MVLFQIYKTNIGKKAVLAITGMVLLLFMAFHLAAILQVFSSQDRLNYYASIFRASPFLRWAVRGIFFGALGMHLITSWSVTQSALKARLHIRSPHNRLRGFAHHAMMPITGAMIFLFVIIHVLHFTVGYIHTSFSEDNVYHNIIFGFQHPAIVAWYIFSLIIIGCHVFKGSLNIFQSIGINFSKAGQKSRIGPLMIATLFTLLWLSIPVAICLERLR